MSASGCPGAPASKACGAIVDSYKSSPVSWQQLGLLATIQATASPPAEGPSRKSRGWRRRRALIWVGPTWGSALPPLLCPPKQPHGGLQTQRSFCISFPQPQPYPSRCSGQQPCSPQVLPSHPTPVQSFICFQNTSSTRICTHVFTVARSTTAKERKQPKCPPTAEQKPKTGSLHTLER